MRIVYCPRQLRDEFRRAPERHRFTLGNVIELAAFHQIHAEVAGALALADFVNWDNAWMV